MDALTTIVSHMENGPESIDANFKAIETQVNLNAVTGGTIGKNNGDVGVWLNDWRPEFTTSPIFLTKLDPSTRLGMLYFTASGHFLKTGTGANGKYLQPNVTTPLFQFTEGKFIDSINFGFSISDISNSGHKMISYNYGSNVGVQSRETSEIDEGTWNIGLMALVIYSEGI